MRTKNKKQTKSLPSSINSNSPLYHNSIPSVAGVYINNHIPSTGQKDNVKGRVATAVKPDSDQRNWLGRLGGSGGAAFIVDFNPASSLKITPLDSTLPQQISDTRSVAGGCIN